MTFQTPGPGSIPYPVDAVFADRRVGRETEFLVRTMKEDGTYLWKWATSSYLHNCKELIEAYYSDPPSLEGAFANRAAQKSKAKTKEKESLSNPANNILVNDGEIVFSLNTETSKAESRLITQPAQADGKNITKILDSGYVDNSKCFKVEINCKAADQVFTFAELRRKVPGLLLKWISDHPEEFATPK